MSQHEYDVSKEIAKADYPFYSLVMAAMRQADTDNLEKLQGAFPEVWAELQARYNAPGGILPEEHGKVPRLCGCGRAPKYCFHNGLWEIECTHCAIIVRAYPVAQAVAYWDERIESMEKDGR